MSKQKKQERPEASAESEGMSSVDLSCSVCGKPREDWVENEGEGVERDGLVYCSEHCAQTSEEEEEED